MDRQAIIQKHFQKLDQLTVKREPYRRCVDDLCEWILKYDMVQRDKTTKLLFSKAPDDIRASILSKQEMVVAGIEEVEYLLTTFTDTHVTSKADDGKIVRAKETLLELRGSPAEILAYERTILNLLQRLSGIATGTHAIIDQIKQVNSTPPLIASTRKTQWTLLDKKAVALGGGGTHRLNLADGVLVKDNHLLLLKEQYGLQHEPDLAAKTIELVSQKAHGLLIEIEIEDEASIDALIKSAKLLEANNNTLCIMLDNFTPGDVKNILASARKKHDLSRIVFEASGGITSSNINDWAQTGVDVLSLGSLTHSTKAVDLSLEII